MNKALLSRDFKWKCVRACKDQLFTKRDYIEAIDLAMKWLPDDEVLAEVVIEIDQFRKDNEQHLQVFIYWNQIENTGGG